MGFEQKFERGLSDRNWRPSLLAFIDPVNIHSPKIVAALVEKALCKDWRNGAFPGLTKITQAFRWARGQLADSAQLQFYISGSNETEILSGFQTTCDLVLAEVNNDPRAEYLVGLAFDHLSDACLNHSLYGQSHDEAVEVLVGDFLRHHSAAKLEPALLLCMNKHGHSPEGVQARRDEVVRTLRLDGVIHDIIIGKENLRAPRTLREKINLEMSLLR